MARKRETQSTVAQQPWTTKWMGPSDVLPTLFTAQGFAAALLHVQYGENAYEAYLRRGGVDWKTGERQSKVVRMVGPLVSPDGNINSMLLESRDARIIVRTPDGGAVEFRVRRRDRITLNPSPQVGDLVAAVDHTLINSKHRAGRLISRATAILGALGAILFVSAVAISQAPAVRRYSECVSSKTKACQPRPALYDVDTAILGSGLVSLALALLVLILLSVIALGARPLHILQSDNISLTTLRRGLGSLRFAVSRVQITSFLKWLTPIVIAAFVGAYIKSKV